MHFLSQIFAVFALSVLSFAACASNVLNYYTFDSGDENFTLQWAYDGWCAVGFTPIADGRNMKDYDMAVGGIAANKTYLWVSVFKLHELTRMSYFIIRNA